MHIRDKMIPLELSGSAAGQYFSVFLLSLLHILRRYSLKQRD